MFSPDGRWVDYSSNESGRYEVYVAAFPGGGGKRQISTDGGSTPLWRRDGRELFCIGRASTMMAAAVKSHGASVEVASVTALFKARAIGDYPYDVSPDGQRFLIVSTPTPTDGIASGITVTVNWTAPTPK